MTEIQELRLIKLEEVKLLTGLGKTTIYELIAKGVFPRAKQTPARRVAWRESEVREWLEGVQPTQPPTVPESPGRAKVGRVRTPPQIQGMSQDPGG